MGDSKTFGIPEAKGLKQPQILFMFKVKYVDSIMMLVRLEPDSLIISA